MSVLWTLLQKENTLGLCVLNYSSGMWNAALVRDVVRWVCGGGSTSYGLHNINLFSNLILVTQSFSNKNVIIYSSFMWNVTFVHNTLSIDQLFPSLTGVTFVITPLLLYIYSEVYSYSYRTRRHSSVPVLRTLHSYSSSEPCTRTCTRASRTSTRRHSSVPYSGLCTRTRIWSLVLVPVLVLGSFYLHLQVRGLCTILSWWRHRRESNTTQVLR